MEFLSRTRWNVSPQGKRRVYFTCHPADFSTYFDVTCEDVFKTQDCAIYYAKDMSESVDKGGEMAWDQVNLVVIPITFHLLSEPNRAMDVDYAFAVEKNIPVLPILMEPGLDQLFTIKFGTMEYLDRTVTDDTMISYEEKLKKFLQAVLISDELAERIRAAFDAYVFLSYRKKDRRYANQLMRLIHANPVCENVAIWYDEYLVPGESFEDVIREALHKSKFLMMVVTPNLTEEGNYVQRIEYPEAQKAGKEILPVEMQSTDVVKLKEMFADLPDVIPGNGNAAFYDSLLKLLAKSGKRESSDDPMHNFLIGLAYLDGIDVEKNGERAISLITKSANAGLYEAATKLSQIYREGVGTKRNYAAWEQWMEKRLELAKGFYGEKKDELREVMHEVADCYSCVGKYEKALAMEEEICEDLRKTRGESDIETILSWHNVAYSHGKLGNYQVALAEMEKIYEKVKEYYGEKHERTLNILSDVSEFHYYLGNYAKAIELEEEIMDKVAGLMDQDHPFLQVCKSKLATYHAKRGEFQKAIEMESEVCKLRRELYGEDHPYTMLSENNLASYYAEIGDIAAAEKNLEAIYEKRKKLLGEEHPDTLTTLNNLAMYAGKMGDFEKAEKYMRLVYESSRKNLGEKHPTVLTQQGSLASLYGRLGRFNEAIPMAEAAYKGLMQQMGEDNPNTLTFLGNLGGLYVGAGEVQKGKEMIQRAVDKLKVMLGENHPMVKLMQTGVVVSGEKKG